MGGAFYKGRPVGSFGDASTFSFCQDKIITTGGEGGLLVLHDTELWKKAWAYKDHGKDYDQISQPHSALKFRYVHSSFGTNWRMTEMQAALGRVQLKKLPQWVEIRRRNAAILAGCFDKIPLFRTITFSAEHYNSYYRYNILINADLLCKGWTRDKLIRVLNEYGVQCCVGSCSEIYLEKAFLNAGLGPKERLPNAKVIGETNLAFLVHPTLTENHMEVICNGIEKVMQLVYEKMS